MLHTATYKMFQGSWIHACFEDKNKMKQSSTCLLSKDVPLTDISEFCLPLPITSLKCALNFSQNAKSISKGYVAQIWSHSSKLFWSYLNFFWFCYCSANIWSEFYSLFKKYFKQKIAYGFCIFYPSIVSFEDQKS